MLANLRVENFALMEEIEQSFGSGLHVFTGETGAGKSMLIDALSVLLGGRASNEFIRHGEESARVEGVFEKLTLQLIDTLTEAGYPAEDGQLFLFREINLSGKNVCRVQGRAVPLSLYRSLCAGLVDIYGQMDHQSLLNAQTHRGLLDAFGGAALMDRLKLVNQLARTYHQLLDKERELSRSDEEWRLRQEMLEFQLQEIDQIQPVPGEEEQLNQEKRRLNNSEKIMAAVTAGYADLYGGSGGAAVYDLMGKTRKELLDLARLDPECTRLVDLADSIYYSVEELAEELRAYREDLEFEPGRLDKIEDRLARLHRLRKYGASIPDILMARDQMRSELEQISHIQEDLAELGREKETVLRKYQAAAADLTELRSAKGQELEAGMARELSDVGLAKARLEVRFSPLAEPALGGAERVEFYFSANLGEPPKPLAKVASGGEMARLMLVMKSMLAQVETVDTFIFDEVDSGVGGRTIQKVGEKLARIAENKQVFCITHAPQVAAFADQHYGITKEVHAERTRTKVVCLNEEERINELARMLGGGEAEVVLQHARELMKGSRS